MPNLHILRPSALAFCLVLAVAGLAYIILIALAQAPTGA